MCSLFSWTAVVGHRDNQRGRRFNVVDFISHPNYTDVRRGPVATPFTTAYNDIALLKLEQPLPLDDVTMMTACVSDGHVTDASFQRCYVTGWGQTLPERSTYAHRKYRFFVRKPDAKYTLWISANHIKWLYPALLRLFALLQQA